MKEIIDIIHKTIYQFFDKCGDNEEMPLTDRDKLLLSVNKAICNNLKALEPKTGHWIEVDRNRYSCSNCSHCFSIVPEDNSIKEYKVCPNCGAKMEE